MRSPAEQNFGVSEYAIEQAIQARIASPGFFQRVAEEVACGLYPDLANRLVPFGRNTDDKTIRGWPDAQLAVDDSAAVVIEATTDKRAVSAHWPEDLRKLKERLDPGQRGGLVWVCWGDEPDTRDFLAMRAEVTALGVPADRVHIYFRRGLLQPAPEASVCSVLARDSWAYNNSLALHANRGCSAPIRTRCKQHCPE